MSDLHPDFERAAEGHRWAEPLAGLFDALKRAAYRAGAGEDTEPVWAWKILPGGAVVAMRVLELDGALRKQVRIARRETPPDAGGRAKWDQELRTFARHLRIDGWRRMDEPDAKGVAALFTEVLPGEDAPGLFDDDEVSERAAPSAIER